MKQVSFLLGLSALLFFACGCQQTRVASGVYSQEEDAWIRTLQNNYSGYRAPRPQSRAIVNNTQDCESAIITAPAPKADTLKQDADAPAPAELPAPAETPAAAEVPEATAAAVPTPAEVPAPADAPAAAEMAPASPAAAVAPAAAAAAETAPAATAAPETASEKKAIEPPDPSSGSVYEVVSGDTLGKISKKHYGSVRYTNMLLKANSDIIKNPNVLKPGMRLIIPKL